jgi:hypothetical protein
MLFPALLLDFFKPCPPSVEDNVVCVAKTKFEIYKIEMTALDNSAVRQSRHGFEANVVRIRHMLVQITLPIVRKRF